MKKRYLAFMASAFLLSGAFNQLHAGGIIVQIVQQSNVLCNGDCNGFATAVASGGMAPFTYNWVPGGSTQSTATGLCAGTYTVTAMDAMGQTATATVNITQPPPLTVTTSVVPASSQSSCDGSATAIVSGGTGLCTYVWTPGNQTNYTATNLCTGYYTVCVTDINGCTSCQGAVVSASTGTQEPDLLNAAFNMYPNPASGSVELELPAGVSEMQLTVVDAFGRTILEMKAASSRKVDVSGWAAGMYFVRLTAAEGTLTRKLVIRH